MLLGVPEAKWLALFERYAGASSPAGRRSGQVSPLCVSARLEPSVHRVRRQSESESEDALTLPAAAINRLRRKRFEALASSSASSPHSPHSPARTSTPPSDADELGE